MAEIPRMVCSLVGSIPLTLYKMKHNTTISICKAIAIIAMVIGHADCPGPIGAFIYEWHMPLFFICSGYFFSLRYLNDEATFVKKRIKGLYLPFLKWSIFFLVIHNLMFRVGIMNERYGNIQGGVTHPYSWHEMEQNLWNIVTSMGSFDQFLAGTFWFFRALLICSLAYLIIYKASDWLLRRYAAPHYHHWKVGIPYFICALMLALASWKNLEGLRITTIVQGGFREIMGIFFFSCGFIFRQWNERYQLTVCSNRYSISIGATLGLFVIVALFSHYAGAAMDWRGSWENTYRLPVPAILGFLMVYNISYGIDKTQGIVKRFLVYCGDHTMCIFVWHILAFKLMSLVKIAYYHLDMGQLGCHMVIHENADKDIFWLLYTLVGVGVPLSVQWLYDYWRKCRNETAMLQ